MGFVYLQTWVISKGKTREHEDNMKKTIQLWKDKWTVHGAKGNPRYFELTYGPGLYARVFMLEFDTLADSEKFFKAVQQDEEAKKLVDEWADNYVEPATWNGVFWEELNLG
jgi:hypothetical protein